MTETETQQPEHKAHALLQEALDTIQATFWIQNKEFVFATATSDGWEDDGYTSKQDWSDWDAVNKAILVELGERIDESDGGVYVKPDVGKAKVTGVCSIGALTLADTTLYQVPLEPYESRATWDFPLWLSGVALAKAIWMREDWDWYIEHSGAQWASVIATWNDRSDIEREDVIEVFTEALKDPLLKMPEGQVPVELLSVTAWGDNPTGFVFATDEEATAFLEQHEASLAGIYGDNRVFQTRPVRHDALVTA